MELKHQLSEGKLYSCQITVLQEKGTLGEDTLVIANNAKEARDKTKDWFKQENPGVNMETLRVYSGIEHVLV